MCDWFAGTASVPRTNREVLNTLLRVMQDPFQTPHEVDQLKRHFPRGQKVRLRNVKAITLFASRRPFRNNCLVA
jgi:hypothetical protein